jgi:hypothetical protein
MPVKDGSVKMCLEFEGAFFKIERCVIIRER